MTHPLRALRAPARGQRQRPGQAGSAAVAGSALFGSDAYAPQEIAARVQEVGVSKARLPLLTLALLGVLAGVFVGLGALMFTLVASDASLGFAASRLLGGLAFSLGLVLVSIAGAELFTGNNLLAMAWASRRIGTAELLRNWGWPAAPMRWVRQGWRWWCSWPATRR